MKRSKNSVEVKRQNRNRVFRYVNGQSTDPSPKQAISPSGNDSPVAKASTFCNSKRLLAPFLLFSQKQDLLAIAR